MRSSRPRSRRRPRGTGHRHHRDDRPRAGLLGEWVSEGQHLNLIGSNFLAKAEADVDVFRRATLIAVDSKEQAKLEAGDFVRALDRGRSATGPTCTNWRR